MHDIFNEHGDHVSCSSQYTEIDREAIKLCLKDRHGDTNQDFSYNIIIGCQRLLYALIWFFVSCS